MQGIRAIETRYAGYRFRSRLEARWAVFFDRAGIRWEYEPQGYETEHGPYLPDFALHNVNGASLFFEVKAPIVQPGDQRWMDLAQASHQAMAIAWGLPRHDALYGWIHDAPTHVAVIECLNGDDDVWLLHRNAWFRLCERCGSIHLNDHDVGYWECCDKPALKANHWRILDAFDAANIARFEHGERG